MQTVVVGGGVTGLTVAYALRGRGEVTLVEADERTGGWLRTLRVEQPSGTWCFESGPEGVLHSPETETLTAELGLLPQQLISGHSAKRRYLYLHGALRPLPSGPKELLTTDLLTWRDRLRLAAEPLVRRRSAGYGPGESMADFARRRFGDFAADVVVDAMASGVFAGDPTKLELASAFPILAELEREAGSVAVAGLRRQLRRAWNRHRHPTAEAPSGRPGLRSFQQGMETLPRALTQALGATVQTGVKVVAVTKVPGRWGGHFAFRWGVHLDTGQRLMANAVVLATPPAVAGTLLAPYDPPLAAALHAIPSASLAVVTLGYPNAAAARCKALDGFGFLAPRGQGLRTLGVIWSSALWPERAPDDHLLLRCMVGGATDPTAVDLEDEALIDIAHADVALAMGLSTRPVFTHVAHHRSAIPQYTVGHARRLAIIDTQLRGQPGLFVAGAGYRGVGVNDSVRDALRVATQVRHLLEL
jgi:oxygen-dependent protoporphyrinogen oxidase